MKVFASDLDQTLIYSKKWIESDDSRVKCIENIEDEPMSYMLLEGIEILKEIDEKHTFIPITTRTLAQYNRIKLPFEPKYAVVANGAIILIDGVVDEVWKKIVDEALIKAMSTSDMKEEISSLLSEDGVQKIGNADGLFLYMITDVDVFDRSALNDYKDFVEDGLWSIHDQGKKVYFVPNIITKGAALKYLKTRNSYNHIVASGDSKLDESMKKVCDYFIVPGHSKLSGDYNCKSSGISSGIEIIKEVNLYFDNL